MMLSRVYGRPSRVCHLPVAVWTRIHMLMSLNCSIPHIMFLPCTIPYRQSIPYHPLILPPLWCTSSPTPMHIIYPPPHMCTSSPTPMGIHVSKCKLVSLKERSILIVATTRYCLYILSPPNTVCTLHPITHFPYPISYRVPHIPYPIRRTSYVVLPTTSPEPPTSYP